MNTPNLTRPSFKANRKPGPCRSNKQPESPEMRLEQADQILRLVETGKLPRNPPPMPKLSGNKRLTKEDEKVLSDRFHTYGCRRSRDLLILSNRGLCGMVANTLCRTNEHSDAVVAGIEGLIRAVETFDSSIGVRFSTYAVPWIRAKIQRHLEKHRRFDEAPAESLKFVQKFSSGKLSQYRDRYTWEKMLRLDQPSNDYDDYEDTLGDQTTDKGLNPEQILSADNTIAAVRKELQLIADQLQDPRYAILIKYRLLADEPETLAEVAERFEVATSREWARQMEKKIMKLARARLAGLRVDIQG